VFAYVATLLRDRGAAEDVTALAFERAFSRRAKFDARRGSERAWLFGIARNAALDELRKRRRSAALAAEPVSEAPAPEDEADLALRRAAVRTALAALPAREREVIALKFHAGLDNAELAAVLGISVSNAGTRLHRALTTLREVLDDRS
jgi:RNA polymerase sigma factor (sigma-70 family)